MHPKNVHVVDFKRKHPSGHGVVRMPEKSEPPAADETVKKLEERLRRVESELKESVRMIETEIGKLAKTKKNRRELTQDVQNLSHVLENRIKKSTQTLQALPQPKANCEELNLTQALSSDLAKILSGQFFKKIFSRTTPDDSAVEVDDFGMDAAFVQKIKPIFDFLYYKYWRVQTTGINNIPNTGRALIVGNHSGTFPYDGSMLATAILNEHPVRKDARFLVENFVYHMPMLGTFMYRIGGVRACPENAGLLLKKEHLVIVFPEGVKGIGKYYNERYRLQRFGRGGFIKLCIQTRSPLVPVGIVGAEEIHPIIFKSNILAKTIGVPYIPITPTFPLLGPLGLIPLPTRWSIHFGKPLNFDEKSLDMLDDELRIHELSEKVQGDIQNILIDLLKKRRSVLLG